MYRKALKGGGMKATSLELVGAIAIGFIFYLLRELNIQSLAFTRFNDLAWVIYLPSGIRLIAVVLYGWIGVLGIVIGWIFAICWVMKRHCLSALSLG